MVVDMVEWKGEYVVMLENGVVERYGWMEGSSEILEMKGRVEYEREVEIGEFKKGRSGEKEVLVYVSSQELLIIEGDTVTTIEGYEESQDDVYAEIDGTNLFILSSPYSHITYYTIDYINHKISSTIHLPLPSSLLPSLPLTSFSYSPNYSLFFLLTPSQLHFLNHHHSSNSLTINPTYNISLPPTSDCQNLVYSSPYIYLTCPDLHRFSIQLSQLKPHSTHTLHHIYPQTLTITTTHEIILKGESHVVYFRAWQARAVEVELVAPLVMVWGQGRDKEYVVYVNGGEIVWERLLLKEDQIRCQASEQHDQGEYIFRVLTTGPCQQNSPTNILISNCLHMRNIEIQVWVPYQLYSTMFVVLYGMMGVVTIGVVGWVLVRTWRLRSRVGQWMELVEEGERREGKEKQIGEDETVTQTGQERENTMHQLNKKQENVEIEYEEE